MRGLVLLFAAVGCSSPSFDLGANADSGTAGADSSPDVASEAGSSPDADGSCNDSPPCAMPSGSYASPFDFAPNTPGPVRLDATHQHRLSFLMDRDGRIERFVLRIKPPAGAIAEEYLSVEVFATICSKEILLGEQTQSVSSSGDYSFIFDGTGATPLRALAAGTPVQVRVRTDSFVGFDVFVVGSPSPNPYQIEYSYRALPDGMTFTPIADVILAAAIGTRGCGT